MVLRNSLNFIIKIFKKTFQQIRKFYLYSNYYDKKISKIDNENLIYKPSPHLLSALIKYQAKKINVDDISFENLWDKENLIYLQNRNIYRSHNLFLFLCAFLLSCYTQL